MSGRKAKRLELSLSVEIEKCVIARGGSREDISIVFSKRRDVFDRCAELILAAVREMKDRLGVTFVVRGGEAGVFSFVPRGEGGCSPSPFSSGVLFLRRGGAGEGRRQGLERPTYED